MEVSVERSLEEDATVDFTVDEKEGIAEARVNSESSAERVPSCVVIVLVMVSSPPDADVHAPKVEARSLYSNITTLGWSAPL